MLKLYIFWGLFALVGLGVVISVMRQRRSPPTAPAPAPVAVASRLQQEEARAAAAKATAHPVAAVVANVTPTAATEPTPAPAFDPSATRIFVGGVHAVTAPSSPQREGTTLPMEGSPRLICVGGALSHQTFAITTAGIKVGRDPHCDIVLADPRTSSHHARIGIVGSKVILRDLESTNGTFLNAKFDAAITETALTPGDTIFFGGHGRDQFRFVVD